MLIEQPRLLGKLFPLYHRQYLVHDAAGDIWFFKEKTDNTNYARYSLTGKTLGAILARSYSAHLYCQFLCRDAAQREVAVFIEDIVTSKRGRHIGSWMVNRLLNLLRQAQGVVWIDRIYGDFRPDRAEIAEKFFERFGFELKVGQNHKRLVTASLSDVKTIDLPDLVDIAVEDVVREWFNCMQKMPTGR